MGKRAAAFALHYGVAQNNALRAISFYHTVIWDVYAEEMEIQKFASKIMLNVSNFFDSLLEEAFTATGEVYEQNSNDLMHPAYSALEELSVSVVQITDWIPALPLVGTNDQTGKLS